MARRVFAGTFWFLLTDVSHSITSKKKKLLNKQNSSNQPNQFQIQFVIDQGDLVSRKT